jgi:hypothetical protein
VLLDQMKRAAPRIVKQAYGRWLRELAPGEVDGVIADGVQAVALAASSARVAFRGENEAAARAWCRRVLLSHVSNELRSRQARRAVSAGELSDGAVSESSFIEAAPAERDDDRLTPPGLARAVAALRLVREHVVRTHRPRDAESTMRAVWCYLEYLSGASIEEQLRTLGESEGAALDADPGTASDARARNRVYKLRQRGRDALRAACAAAVNSARAASHPVLGRFTHHRARAETAGAAAVERLGPAGVVHTFP